MSATGACSSASERWRADDTEHENYTDSGGKSGGQKEKLAYTILAASLAYQFNLKWGVKRSKDFRFVVIDEAFGRGSDESTRFALTLFRKLGLQLLIVTPLQKIHVIEPFVASRRLRGEQARQQFPAAVPDHRGIPPTQTAAWHDQLGRPGRWRRGLVTDWSTPDSVRARLRRRWDTGHPLTERARGAPFAPVDLPIRGPTASELAARLRRGGRLGPQVGQPGWSVHGDDEVGRSAPHRRQTRSRTASASRPSTTSPASSGRPIRRDRHGELVE